MLILAAIPLGNPADASLNLREAIVSAKFIAAEDSRKFSRLCLDLGITYSAKIISFFEGNEIERLDELVKILESGSDLLVVTDAGMPGISDPGYRLARAAVEKNIKIKVLPVSVIPDSAGAALRSSNFILVTAPLPSIKLSSATELPPPHAVKVKAISRSGARVESLLRINYFFSGSKCPAGSE